MKSHSLSLFKVFWHLAIFSMFTYFGGILIIFCHRASIVQLNHSGFTFRHQSAFALFCLIYWLCIQLVHTENMWAFCVGGDMVVHSDSSFWHMQTVLCVQCFRVCICIHFCGLTKHRNNFWSEYFSVFILL